MDRITTKLVEGLFLCGAGLLGLLYVLAIIASLLLPVAAVVGIVVLLIRFWN